MVRSARAALFLAATLATTVPVSSALAQSATAVGGANSTTAPPVPAAQGIAVIAAGPARDEAFTLARAVYGSRLRPPSLDEIRARVLAGDPPPSNATRELRELAEVRASLTGDDGAAERRLLAGLAQQVGAQALLVVKVERSAPITPPVPPPPSKDEWPSFEAPSSARTPSSDAVAGTGPAPGNAAAATTVVARLFLADSAVFDAARYSPEAGLVGAAMWKSTVTSLEARFPASSRVVAPGAATRATPGQIGAEDQKSTPFYTSGWFWGSVGAAALLGAAFYFASRDTSTDTIHLQMRVPK